MRVCLLASGSRGNSALIEVDGTRLLIDAGLSGRETERRLAPLGLTGDDLHAILVTHEHHDHVTGIGPLARRYSIPVFIDEQTHRALPRLGSLERLNYFTAGEDFTVHDLQIDPFSTTHDAINPVGFSIRSSEGKIGFVTDLGCATRLVLEQLKEARVLVLEANHDEQMLLDGPYPWHLKERIRSRHGHLSNHDCARMLADLAWPGLEALFLAHLSEENNCPELCAQQLGSVLARHNRHSRLIVGQQQQASICFNAGR